MSALVDGLVVRDLIIRRTHSTDRRRMTLELTTRGTRILQAAHEATASYLEEKIGQLSASERETVTHAMQVLRDAFTEVVH
jgi:DNA-binding MarR family transcriptional regulator